MGASLKGKDSIEGGKTQGKGRRCPLLSSARREKSEMPIKWKTRRQGGKKTVMFNAGSVKTKKKKNGGCLFDYRGTMSGGEEEEIHLNLGWRYKPGE